VESESNDILTDGLATITEAQAFTRLSRSDLYARMERGELAYCKLGRRRLIPRRALMEMAQKSLVVRRAD
jgi:excisionase family DNA binding protein